MSEGTLFGALAAAQAEMQNAPLNKTNPHFRSKYADLASIRDATVPVLAKHGLSVFQTTRMEGHDMLLVTTLAHTSGEKVESHYPIPVTDKPQVMGSCLTYARRYSLAMITGIAADDDDDANLAQSNGRGLPAKRTMAEISAQKIAKENAQEEFLRDLQDVHSLVALDRLEKEWRAYLNGDSPHAYTAQEHVEKKRAELSGEQPVKHNDTFVPNARERRRQAPPADMVAYDDARDAMDEAESALDTPPAEQPTDEQKRTFGELKTWLLDAKTEESLNKRMANKDYMKHVYSLTAGQREELEAFIKGRVSALSPVMAG